MAAIKDKKLQQLCKEFFEINSKQYPNCAEITKAFLKEYPGIKGETQLRQLYFKELFNNTENIEDSLDIEESKDNKIISYKGEKSITSLQEAIDFFKVDLKIWEVADWKCKSWDTSMNIKVLKGDKQVSEPIKRTNYAVSVNLKRRIEEIDYKKIINNIDKLYKTYPIIKQIKGTKIGVLTIADIHIGLKVTKQGGIINTPENNIENVIRYLNEVAKRTNSFNYQEIHLVILGDLVESVSGYNHIETLKEMESTITGGNIIILAYEVLAKFIGKIKNLKKVYLISGNHDRLTPDKAMDKDGGACQLVAYMLKNIVDVEWHPFIISKNIDGIQYLMTHGHLKITNQDLGKLFFEYGSQDKYNVMLSGHWHTRKHTKVFSEKNLILADTSKYRSITVSPITSGTRWTEENGWSCAPGFTITEASNSKNNINFLDLALN